MKGTKSFQRQALTSKISEKIIKFTNDRASSQHNVFRNKENKIDSLTSQFFENLPKKIAEKRAKNDSES